jgi:hypothetical protein
MKNLITGFIILILNIGLYGQKQGAYFIQSAIGGKYLDVKNAGTANGTPLHLWPHNGTIAQKFTLENAGGGYFYIKSHLGKYIHIQNASSKPEALALIWEGKGNDNTKWKFKDVGNGYFSIQSKLGTYLDVKWGKDANGTPIWMWTGNEGIAQKWKLVNYKNDIKEHKIETAFHIGELCPNTQDGHMKAGNRHLDGKVNFKVDGKVYFNEDKSKLLVDIHFEESAISTDTRVVADWNKLVFYSAPKGYSINSFFYECGNRGFDGVFNHKRCEYPAFDGKKDFYVSGILPEGGFEAKPFSFHDGFLKNFTLKGDPYLLSSIAVIGDTGTEDISDDRNCEHDSKIVGIYPQKIPGSWNVELVKSAIVENNMKKVRVSLENIKGQIHNADCTRLQGEISVKLKDLKTNRIYQPISKNKKLLTWNGIKAKDFDKRNLWMPSITYVEFNVDENNFTNDQIGIEISSNIKGCHKSCDLCSGYHCDLIYKEINFPFRNKLSSWKLKNSGELTTFFSVASINKNTGQRDNDKHFLSAAIIIK